MQQLFTRNEWFFITMIFLLLLKPAPGILFGGASVVLFTFSVMLISAVLFFISRYETSPIHTLVSITKQSVKDKVILFLFATIISFSISTIYGVIFVSDKTRISDFQELYRYVFYIVFYLTAVYIVPAHLARITKTIFGLFIGIELFGVMQFYNIFNINETIGNLYTISERHSYLITVQSRIPSTLLNPNMYGSFLIIVAALLLSFLIFNESRNNNIIIYSGLLLTIFSVFITTSRTAIIVLAMMIVYWILLNLVFHRKNQKKTMKHGFFVLLLFLLIALVSFPQIEYLRNTIKQIYDNTDPSITNNKGSLDSVSSIQNRYEYWDQNMDQFKQSPLIGSGPMKHNFVSFADHSYLFILARYGLVGLAVFLLFGVYMFWKSFKTYIGNSSLFQRQIGLAVNLIIIAFLIMGFVSEVWFNLQSMTFLFVLIGLMLNRQVKDVAK